ncbi:MAG: S8 family serine peptidase [Pseudomonadota bacterium]
MRSILKCLLCMSVLLLVSACESFHLKPPPLTGEPSDAVRAEVAEDGVSVIALINNVDLALLLERKARREGFRLLRRERLPGLGVVMLTFAVPPGLDVTQAAAELERLEPHATADRDHQYGLSTDAGTPAAVMAQPLEFAHAMIQWPAQGCASLRRLGMIDSGVDLTAPSLADQRIVTSSFVGEVAAHGRSHGTAVAQTLIGDGRLREGTLHAAVVFDEARPQAGPSASTLIRALDWLVQSRVELVNVSLAGPYNRALDRAVQRATDVGLLLVAAVGNEGPDSPPRYPAAFADVIAVTAVDAALRIYDGAVMGAHVDFAAPGVDIYVQADGRGRYVTGTSFASPFVVSIIASDPSLKDLSSASRVRQSLADKARDLGAPGHDETFGFGLPALSAQCSATR